MHGKIANRMDSGLPQLSTRFPFRNPLFGLSSNTFANGKNALKEGKLLYIVAFDHKSNRVSTRENE